jgi:flagellar biosynthesis anti-sigma factor FlgM
MRIDLTTLGLQQAENTKTARTANRAAGANAETGSAAGAESGDRAQFSFDQGKMESLVAAALGAPEVRQAKVESLAAAVAGGQYAVDAGKVAGAMAAEYGAGAGAG